MMQISKEEYKHLKLCEIMLAKIASDGIYNNIRDWDNFRTTMIELNEKQYNLTFDYLVNKYWEILDEYKNRKITKSK